MLLALRSLWESAVRKGAGLLLALNSLVLESETGTVDVTVTGTGVAATPAIGTGLVLITSGTGVGGISSKRRLSRLRELGYFVPVPVDVEVLGEGVRASPHVRRGTIVVDSILRIRNAGAHARPRIGTGDVLIKVDFSDEELVALLLAA